MSDIIASGILPAAIEMMDRLAIQAAEAAVHANYPDCGGLLLVELDGPEEEVKVLMEQLDTICISNGSREICLARTAAERALFWKGRKAAFAATGRISPNYIVQDGVVPRTALPEIMRDIERMGVKTHPRKPPGGRFIDAQDYPVERSVYALRDVQSLQRQAASHGEAVGRFAAALLDSPLPWTRMRRVYALLGLARRYGAGARLNEVCATALGAEMLDVRRLQRMLEQAATPSAAASPAPLPSARFLRPASQYALLLALREPSSKKKEMIPK